MAEGTSLLRMHTAYTRIVGSNPTVSAKNIQKTRKPQRLRVFCFSAFEYAIHTNPIQFLNASDIRFHIG